MSNNVGAGGVDYDDVDDKLKSRDERYKDSVEALARSYGGAKSPFKSIRHARKHLAQKY